MSLQEESIYEIKNNCEIEAKLNNDSVYLRMKVFSYENLKIQVFQDTLTNQSLSPQIRMAFGNINQLFQKCFRKKENYSFHADGSLSFKYKIVLESEEITKNEIIHLQTIAVDEIQMLKQICQRMKNVSSEQFQKINDKEDQLNKKDEQIRKLLQVEEIQCSLTFQKPKIQHIGSFAIKDGTKITKEKNNICSQLLLTEHVHSSKICSFSFKILQSLSNSIMIGIVDQKRKGQVRSFNSEGNALCYHGQNNGIIYPDKIQQGNGFKVNDTVQCIVNLKEGIIIWMVNNKKSATIQKDFLKQKGRVFVPFIEMAHQNDEVQLIEMTIKE